MTQETNSSTSKVAAAPTDKKTRSGIGSSGTTKKAQLIQMLSRKAGADVATISGKLGWLPHTTRAALTGLRKSGYELASEKPGKGKSSRYCIIAEPAADVA